MHRAFARGVGALVGSAPAAALALGLGPIQIESYLNEPLRARIELSSFEPEAREQIKVGLADAAAFERAGLDRPWWLEDLRFQVETLEDGSGVVSLSTDRAVREPIAAFVVEAVWPEGRLHREYALLIDPRPEPAGLAQPSASPRVQADAAEAVASAPPVADSQRTYGPTRRTDTAWVIASRARPSSAVSVEQTMMALLRENPEAFIDGNVNLLRRGVTLRVPSAAEIAAMTGEQARASFAAQTRDWKAGRVVEQAPDAAPEPPEPAGEDAGGLTAPAPPAEGAPPAAEPRLEIVAPDEGMEAQLESLVRMSTGQRIEVLRERVEEYKALNRELERRNDRLEDRLRTIEERMTSMREMLAAQNEQLSRYQSQLDRSMTPQGSPAPAPVEAPPPGPGAEVLPADARPPAAADTWTWLRSPLAIGLALAAVLAALLAVQVMRRRRAAEALAGLEGVSADSPSSHLDAALVEIDVALAYRKLSQVENLLDGAEARFGDEPALKAKRLELYAFRKDRRRFAEYLEQVHESLRDGPPEYWEHVQRLARGLIPDHPLIEPRSMDSRGAA